MENALSGASAVSDVDRFEHFLKTMLARIERMIDDVPAEERDMGDAAYFGLVRECNTVHHLLLKYRQFKKAKGRKNGRI